MATDPATQSTTLYAKYPTYLVSKPQTTVAASISTVATSSAFGATQQTAINSVMATLIALGFWATS
jgi:hypothetical protein